MTFFRVFSPDKKSYEKLQAKWHALPTKNTSIFIDISDEKNTLRTIDHLITYAAPNYPKSRKKP